MLSVSTCGVLPGESSPRAVLEWVRGLGVRAVTIDVRRAGLRPRELGASARRDLAALLRRSELALAGLDLFLPPEHFADAATSDRAATAAVQACEMAAELAAMGRGAGAGAVGRVVHVRWPGGGAGLPVLDELARAAERLGVRLADCAHPSVVLSDAGAGLGAGAGVGVDPAVVVGVGESPGKAVVRAGERLAALRLSDVGVGGERVPVGTGRVDVTAFVGAALVSGVAMVTLDLTGVRDAQAGAAAGLAAWARATRLPGG